MTFHLYALALAVLSSGIAGIAVGYLLAVMIMSDGEWKH